MRKFLIFVLLLCQFCPPVFAYDKSGFAVLGVGTVACKIFIQQMEESPEAATAIYSQWQLGFISALNYSLDGVKDHSHALNRETLLNNTLKTCRLDPSETFFDVSKKVLWQHTQEAVFSVENSGLKENKDNSILNRRRD